MPKQIVPISINNSILTPQEQSLVASKEMIRIFGSPEDFVQLFIYDRTNFLLYNNPNYKNYSVTENKTINFDPEFDLTQAGFELGTYNMVYNFLRPLLTLSPELDLFIYQISPDRKEIKIRTTLDNDLFYTNAVAYIDLIQTRSYFIEYYLDLGNNNLITALSLAAEKDVFGTTTVIAKLENPLPLEIIVNSPLNIVEKVVNTQEFEAIATPDNFVTASSPSLRQANFSLDVDSYRIGSSDYYNYNQITNLTQSNELQTMLSFISSSNPTINVDYTDYNNFIHFGSAVQQLDTFKYKLGLIQSYENAINILPPTDLNSILYKNQINGIIQNFTGYENYLYYQSSSYAWPKANSTLPYINQPTGSVDSITWYNLQSTSASYYDEFNNNNLIYALPQYLQESPTFSNVSPFVWSMGQMFDDIWLYIKAMTDLWKADNALQDGISKDLVGDALQSLGIKLYTDGDQDDLYTWLYGTNQSGSNLFQTASWQTGITASQYTMPGQDETKGIFKRIYANLPTLLKSKGTNKFINYLNTLYGIPDTILFPMEFGGVDKSSSTSEYIYNKFTYALQAEFQQYVWVSRNTISTDTNQVNTLELRFKPTKSTQTQTVITSTDHSLTGITPYWGVTITGSVVDGYDYGTVSIHLKNTLLPTLYQTYTTPPIPLFVTGSDKDTNWWNLKVSQNGSNYSLIVQNEIQGQVGHTASVVFTTTGFYSLDGINQHYEVGNINKSFTSVFPSQFGSGNYYGQLQEFRGWLVNLSSSAFDAHTVNPESYIGNSTSSAYNDLLFRFPLGNDLYLPTLTETGSQPNPGYNRQINFSGVTQNSYVPFTEIYYTKPAIGGFSVPVTDKVRIVNETLASTQLKPFKSVIYPKVVPTTMDINLTQTGFSPQDQINNDIIAQLGDTYNLDDIIGNPQFSNLNYYPGLEPLQEEYFQKYIGSYNYKDFIQLIETFHKSLFRYLADYIPGRSVNATGIVIKPHILERSKTRRYEPTIDTASYSGETWTVTITGSNPGNYCCSRNSPLNEAFFDGEFEGSVIPMDSYYTQNNPFTRAICDCRLYQITTDALVVYVDCNGETKFNTDPGQRTFQIYACKDKVDNLFGSNFYVQDLGQFAEKQAFIEQYEGWDVLDNNVEDNTVSQFKKKRQPSLQDLFGKCFEYRLFNPDVVSRSYSYTRCDNVVVNGTLAPTTGITVQALEDSVKGNVNVTTLRNNTNNPVSSSVEWQDSYLTDAGYVLLREKGVQTTSPSTNTTFPADFTFNVGGNTILGSNSYPNTEQTVDYMLYYDWVTSSLADKIGTSNFHIKYLIDSSGSVSKPTFTSSYYYNTEQGFEAYTPVNVTIYDAATGNTETSVATTTYRPVRKYQSIIYSDTGSRGNKMRVGYFQTMSFTTTDRELITGWNSEFQRSGDYVIASAPLGATGSVFPDFNVTIANENGSFDSTTSTFTALGTGQYKARIQVGMRFFLSLGTICQVDMRLFKNGVLIASDSDIIILSGGGNGKTLNIDVNSDINENDTFSVDVMYSCGSPFQLWWSDDVGTFSITDSSPLIANSDLDVTYPYATRYFGGWLLTSQFNPFYGNTGSVTYNQDSMIPGSTLNSGFSNTLPFEFQQYDEVRFEGSEDKVYTIMTSSLETIGSSQRRLVIFDRPLPTTINPNYFVVRRLVPDPGFVIINGTQYQGPGFIIPTYPTPQLKNNLSNIIAELSSKGLI